MSLVRYTPAQKADALKVLAEVGTTTEAERRLAVLWDVGPSREALRRWRHQMPEAYQRARELVIQDRRQRIRTRRTEVMERSLDVTGLALDQMRDALEAGEIEPRDLGGILKASMVAHGIATDKFVVGEGEPSHIVAKADTVEESLRRLHDRFGIVDSTAEEDADED